jgi:hypothetical protein
MCCQGNEFSGKWSTKIDHLCPQGNVIKGNNLVETVREETGISAFIILSNVLITLGGFLSSLCFIWVLNELSHANGSKPQIYNYEIRLYWNEIS